MRFTLILAAALLLGACSSVPPAKERISVDLRSLKLTAGSAEAQFDRIMSLGGLKKGNIDVSYYPSSDVVCLQFRVDYVTVYQFWSKDNRDAFISALEKYKDAYEQRTLVDKKRKTKREYGKVLALSLWETTRFSAQGRGYPYLELGYYFKQKSPFFAITQLESENENEQVKTGNRNSATFAVYFTRAQAENLAALFDQELLTGLGLNLPDKAESYVEKDDY